MRSACVIPGHRRLGLAWIAAVIPFLALAVSVYLWGVDLPYWDQWMVVPLIEKLMEGRLEAADLWRQHGDHRVFFPRLFMLAMARATGWNIRWELAAVVAAAAVLFLVVTRWLQASCRSPAGRWIAAPAVSLLVFNLSQWENWTWGFQLVILTNVVAVAGGLRLLARGADRVRDFLLAAALGTVATHSFANGILFWPLALPLVAGPARNRRPRLTAWIAIAVVVEALFFYRYSFPLGESPPELLLEKIPLAAAYVVVFLGAPLSPYDGKLAAVAGVLGCGAFVGLVVLLIRGRRPFAERALPWIVFAGYGIASAALAAAGRLEHGLGAAMSSRYLAFANFFWLGLLGLALVLPADPEGRAFRAPARIAAAAVAASLVAGSVWGGVLIHQQYLDRSRLRAQLHEGRFPSDLLLVIPGDTVPPPELEVLRRYRLSLFRP